MKRNAYCMPHTRYTTGIWTKRYLREQLQVALAGRAGEEVRVVHVCAPVHCSVQMLE